MTETSRSSKRLTSDAGRSLAPEEPNTSSGDFGADKRRTERVISLTASGHGGGEPG